MSVAASAIFLVGRILFVALFVVSAQGHIANHDRYVTTARGKIPVPYVAGWPVGAWLVLAILSTVLGIWPDVGVLMVAAFLIPTTILFHPFWRFFRRNPATDTAEQLLPQRQPSRCHPRPFRVLDRCRTRAVRYHGIPVQPALSRA